ILETCDWELVRQLYAKMREEAKQAFGVAASAAEATYRMAADMRFAGQYHELRVDLPDDADGPHAVEAIEAAFRAGYATTYGRAPEGMRVEVLNWHLIAELPRPGFALASEPEAERDPQAALRGERPVYFAQPTPGFRPCPIYDRYKL